MYGVKFVVSPGMCEMRHIRWVRTHRNNRIARKWQKRYGAVYACRSESVVRLFDTLCACPHMKGRIRREINRPSAGNYSAAHTATEQFRRNHGL